ncbi:MAG: IS1182 family transposase [Acidaminococcaceae bacterium]|nr:IS1182 family transposase [Acidaminococcaceae bacterium]
MIPETEPVRLLDAVLEELDYTALLRLYSPQGRKSAVPPRILFKVIVFAMLEGVYSLRAIQRQCQVNIQYMWLLQGYKVSSHMAIGRFYERLTVPVLEDLFAQFIHVLSETDSVTMDEVYIGGTKLEANANRYTFVWRKNIERGLKKLKERYPVFREKTAQTLLPGPGHLEDTELLAALAGKCKEEEVCFVSGRGRHKPVLQKAFEECEAFCEKRREYEKHLAILGERNSYAKTDPDATFMRMKEDHMKNGQLKAAYNVQLAVESEYIVGVGIFPNPTDTLTLIPFLKHMRSRFGLKPLHVVADAGYDSEGNLNWLREQEYKSVIKPASYEISRKKQYKKRIGLPANMKYDSEADEYTCAKGRKLRFSCLRKKKHKSGYVSELRVYQCTNCQYCGQRKQCQRQGDGKHNKTIQINRKYDELQQENMQRFLSEEGIRFRVNRSIQAEGAFGQIKQDYSYKRILRRGKEAVYKELLFLALGFNIRKLHNRIQNERITQRFLQKKDEEKAC